MRTLTIVTFFVIRLISSTVRASSEFLAARPRYDHSIRRSVNDSVCSTPACQRVASDLLSRLSPNYTSIDPCSNFDKIVCGSEAGEDSSIYLVSASVQRATRQILEANAPPKSEDAADIENFAKLSRAYRACKKQDESQVAEELATKLLNIVAKSFIRKSYYENRRNGSDLTPVFQSFLDHGIISFLDIYPTNDAGNPDVNIVKITPGFLTLGTTQQYSNATFLESYRSLIPQTIHKLFPNTTISNSSLSRVIEFERRIADIFPDRVEFNNITRTYNVMPLRNVSKLIPQIDLHGLLSSAAPSVAVTSVQVDFPEYLVNLSRILLDTPLEIVHAYFLWATVQTVQPINDNGVQTSTAHHSRLFLKSRQHKRQNKVEIYIYCPLYMTFQFGWMLSRFYSQQVSSNATMQYGERIVSDLKAVYNDKIKSKSWMDKTTTKAAIEKLDKMRVNIGVSTKSPDVTNATSIRDFYADVEINDSFSDNFISVRQFQQRKVWSLLGRPVDRDVWNMLPITTNALYDHVVNSIVLPIGIIQPPILDPEAPKYLNYGSLGTLVGHEISHGFDTIGRDYDWDGRYSNWWSNATRAGFDSRAQCFVEQYNNYTVTAPDGKIIHANGKRTLAENIADAGGLSASFAAWKKRVIKEPDLNLPGLEFFTQEQLFFVAYARLWCQERDPEEEIARMEIDSHAPRRARILYGLANSEAFKRSFSCPVKEPVCELW